MHILASPALGLCQEPAGYGGFCLLQIYPLLQDQTVGNLTVRSYGRSSYQFVIIGTLKVSVSAPSLVYQDPHPESSLTVVVLM